MTSNPNILNSQGYRVENKKPRPATQLAGHKVLYILHLEYGTTEYVRMPLVRFGTPPHHPLSRTRVCTPTPKTKGGGHSPAGEGGGAVPIWTTGEKA